MSEEEITFERAQTWAKDKKDIFAPKDSIDKGRIADIEVANILAISEQKHRDLEDALKRESAVGNSDEQEKMLDKLESIKIKYPDALVEEVSNGLRMWFVDVAGSKEQYVFTLDGLFKVWLKTSGSYGTINNQTLNLEVLSAKISNIIETEHGDIWCSPDEIASKKYLNKFYTLSDYIVVHKVGLTENNEGDNLKEALETAKKQKDLARDKKTGEEEILDNL